MKLIPRCKIWIVDSSERVLMGGGRQCILEVIDKTGSMNKAAQELGMSFRTVWGKVRETEKRLGFRIVENRTNSRRGGSQLTPAGRVLLDKYRRFREEATRCSERIFAGIFAESDIEHPEEI